MKILCKQEPKLQANQQVNRVGKYLFKNIDGAFSFKTRSNMCDVYFTLLYQDTNSGSDKVYDMTIDLNITTYQNKVRVNIIEMDPNERTIGYDCYDPNSMKDLQNAKKMILNKIIKKVSNAYKDYDFLF